MEKPIKNFDNDELVSLAGSGLPVRQSHAQAELTRRLIKALVSSKESTDRYNKVLLFITTMMFLVALVQLILSSATLPGFPEWVRIVGTIAILIAILTAGYMVLKEMEFNK